MTFQVKFRCFCKVNKEMLINMGHEVGSKKIATEQTKLISISGVAKFKKKNNKTTFM